MLFTKTIKRVENKKHLCGTQNVIVMVSNHHWKRLFYNNPTVSYTESTGDCFQNIIAPLVSLGSGKTSTILSKSQLSMSSWFGQLYWEPSYPIFPKIWLLVKTVLWWLETINYTHAFISWKFMHRYPHLWKIYINSTCMSR